MLRLPQQLVLAILGSVIAITVFNFLLSKVGFNLFGSVTGILYLGVEGLAIVLMGLALLLTLGVVES
ncbi:hypothetical protein HAPAU_29720 [Halalkalicoccus paucihalophilus]|uniref:Uncharacterized protein n=1 Tax=Halalkalicoccus paucihalophilus TaxID=1008153 RepID=A0A151ABE8_9EURY|nr:hypothetical protein HAPAU_29720 [Halalkalicoccus paucihalophilus]